MSNSLDPDQARCVGPDLGPNSLQRLSEMTLVFQFQCFAGPDLGPHCLQRLSETTLVSQFRFFAGPDLGPNCLQRLSEMTLVFQFRGFARPDLGPNCLQRLSETSLVHNFLLIGEEGEEADLDAPKIYEPVPTLESLADKLNSYMEQYNETIRGAKMDLVFFKVKFPFK